MQSLEVHQVSSIAVEQHLLTGEGKNERDESSGQDDRFSETGDRSSVSLMDDYLTKTFNISFDSSLSSTFHDNPDETEGK